MGGDIEEMKRRLRGARETREVLYYIDKKGTTCVNIDRSIGGSESTQTRRSQLFTG